ncbi:MAG: tRNA (adenosine(37)-N6)-threonylcarbamoyltransferase complex transferase subunit TsaD [Candidatus Nomurabacteria bacterium]
MKILAIETSCDETAISIIEVKNEGKKIKFKILGNEVSSQIALHIQYGGVFPMMAKREHGKNIIGVLEKTFKEAKMYKVNKTAQSDAKLENKINKLLDRENEIQDRWMSIMPFIKKPNIDAIAVTTGPGLEPALWVGISFAKALSIYWDIPIVPVNHMEGHVFSIFPKKTKNFTIEIEDKMFPMLSLLVSGGHTELVLVKDWMKYKNIGQTRDDAAGEAFDKVARMMGLPYPGGPEISRLAKIEREYIVPGSIAQAVEPSTSKKSSKVLLRADGNNISSEILDITLPRPMIHSKDYDFSFSGLKTAVLYLIRDLKIQNSNVLEDINIKQKIAREFEDAVVETLVHKTIKAIKEYKIQTLIVGGGVSANSYLQKTMTEKIKENKLKVKIHFPSKTLTGDNALMIAIAGYFQAKNKKFAKNINSIKAQGNLSL